ncbi:MAG: helicase SNF2, partial [Xanthomonadales bacterium]|nr:helicase SNF2 [Xanthomonadales bacterium]
VQARADGYRIACVVDEAHHGFQSAKEAKRFFAEVLKPDYALLMTATPDDEDARRFARDTGYHLGGSDRLASLSRADGVEEGLLKRGVKLVRFIARNDDEKSLIDFEHTALDESVRLHRQIKALLAEEGIPLTPLMLVQVPDDKSYQRIKGAPSQIEQVRVRLVEEWGFADSAVRTHSAAEPDPDLIALAADPNVEVLVFKMAVALGFDAARAFTLCALRGVRDTSFGVQVVGRLMRVHPLLQGRKDLPRELDFGYVFLANFESQEGLLDAGKLINAMETQGPELGTQTVVTVIAGQPQVQVVRQNEAPALFRRDEAAVSVPIAEFQVPAEPDFAPAIPLFEDDGSQNASTQSPASAVSALSMALRADARRQVTAKRAARVPAHVVTEALPDLGPDIEERVAALVDFSAQVLASQQGEWAQVERKSRDMFDGRHLSESPEEDSIILAQLDAAAVAGRVERQFGLFGELQHNKLLHALTNHFRESLKRNNIRPPEDAEDLDHRLDLVLAHHPKLLRAAFKRARLDDLYTREVELPALAAFDAAGIESRRNAYGRYPDDLNNDEYAFAKLLDAEPSVRWWHRNPVRQPSSVALFGWDHGAGFYPDFVVSVEGRKTQDNIVLVEIKGPQLWNLPSEALKIAGGRHPKYGEIVA